MRTVTSAILTAALLCTVSARADDLIRRGGEWQSTTTGIGAQPRTMVMCFSQSTLSQAMARLAEGKQCSKQDVHVDGNRVTFDLVCGAMSMQGTATRAGDTAYTADMTMHMNAGGTERVMHTVTDAKWIGPCKPGENPVN